MRTTTRKTKQEMPRLAQPPRKGLVYPTREGMEAVWEDQPPRRNAPPSTASGARQRVGPFKTHDTSECRRFDKDGNKTGKS